MSWAILRRYWLTLSTGQQANLSKPGISTIEFATQLIGTVLDMPPVTCAFGPMNKSGSIILLCFAVILGMSPWFATAAALPDMAREAVIPAFRQALLSSAVQAGFVVGAVASAFLGIADRFDPRRVMAATAMMNAVASAALLWAPLGGDTAIALRFLAGAGFAGVYPVGMKIVVGWGVKDRALLVGILIGALTFGSGAPHLAAFLGGADWRVVIVAVAAASAIASILTLFVRLGPHHAQAPAFSPSVIRLMWTDRRIRAATGGYLGHMWELYVMWGWIAAATATGYALTMGAEAAVSLSALTAFCAIAAGAVTCAPAGWAADRWGKARVATTALILSGTSALLMAVTLGLPGGGPVWLIFALALVWGAFVIPDSGLFSAMIADAAPAEAAGSLMTMQTALGFALTAVTVQVAPLLAENIGWNWTLALLALGPAGGIWALKSAKQ
ncbi:MAG: MFS transporter [Pikeienuella sp.]